MFVVLYDSINYNCWTNDDWLDSYGLYIVKLLKFCSFLSFILYIMSSIPSDIWQQFIFPSYSFGIFVW